MVSKKLLEQATPIIHQIAKHKRRHKFAYFTREDISQEVWRIALQALRHYRPRRGPLENYLRVAVNNRLRKLKRERYFRPDPANHRVIGQIRTRIGIVNALPLGTRDVDERCVLFTSSSASVDSADALQAKELQEFIEVRLSADLRAALGRALEGNSVDGQTLETLRQRVLVILEEWNGQD
jgi:DNA-directed RNA polymerase specialized sigma24 family protein